MSGHSDLTILQHNTMKSRNKVMASMLRDPQTWEYDILAIQEPWRNSFNNSTHHPCKDRFHLVYPTAIDLELGPARVCFFVNTRLDRAKWTFKEHSKDLITLDLQYMEHKQRKCLHIHNIYREAIRGDVTETLERLNNLFEEDSDGQHVVVGDFNLHHPAWGGLGIEGDREAEQLLTIIDERQLSLLLPQGSITWRAGESKSTIDLALGTPSVTQRLASCEVKDESHDSDHLPIVTTLLLEAPEATPTTHRQWDKLDREAFQKALVAQLPRLEPVTDLMEPEQMEQQIRSITEALQQAIQKAVPLSQPSKWSKPGFGPEAKEVIREVNRARRKWQRRQTEETWEAYSRLRNTKGKKLAKLMRNTHRERVEAAATDPKGLWKLAKWAKSRGTASQAFTPALQQLDGTSATGPEEKAELLRAAFFPTPPEADLSDIENYEYPEPLQMPLIAEQELSKAILQAPGSKAPGPDGIPNSILHLTLPHILPQLLPLYNQCLKSGIHLEAFKRSTTVVLRKPNKGDYRLAKAYRPVALLNTLGKAMESVMARRISWMAETYQLLPRTLLGGRKGVSTEHAVHTLMEVIQKAWNSDTPVTSLLMLDVSGAFDNVSHQRLLHNLKKRRIPLELVSWIESFLKGRTSTLRLPEYESEPFSIHTGIPQGSPLSPILYLFYNADLLDMGSRSDLKATTVSWIDDVGFAVTGASAAANCQILQTLHIGAEAWASKHASVFAPAKYELIHFTNKPGDHDTSAELVLQTNRVSPSRTCRVLGVILDSQLDFEAHIQHIEAKVTTSLGGLAAIAGSTWGFGLKDLRRLYISVILPQILYCCSAWYVADRAQGTVIRRQRILQKLTAIQQRAGSIIAGAFQTTAGPALDVELFLLPMKQQLEKAAGDATARILTSPIYQELTEGRRLRQRRAQKLWSPIERTTTQGRVDGWIPDTLPETRHPFVVPPWWDPPAIYIASSADAAIRAHDVNALCRDDGVLDIFTDGSAIGGHVGAAAVAPRLKEGRICYMGTEEMTTVFGAELQGIVMATAMTMTIKETRGQNMWAVNIYVDNQAAIRASANPGRQSGQYLLREVVQGIDRLREAGVRIQIHWIPAHVGVPGNEEADIAAKTAAQGLRAYSREVFYMLATCKQKLQKRVFRQWAKEWENGVTGRKIFHLEKEPNSGVLTKHTGVRRPLSSLITQLRTGKIALAHYLHRIQRRDSPRCPCSQGIQTVRHILTECPRTQDLREELLGRAHDVRRILKDSALVKAAAILVLRGNLLGQFQDVTEASGDLQAQEKPPEDP